MPRGVLVAGLCLAIVGCERGHEAQAGETREGEAARPAAARPTFRGDVVPVLEANCAGAHGCHGAEPTTDVALDLRADNAYEELVSRAAKRRPGAVLVKPGDPDASFLVDKLLGHLAANEGKAMPLHERSGEVVQMTPPAREFVDRVLRPWISAGAPLE